LRRRVVLVLAMAGAGVAATVASRGAEEAYAAVAEGKQRPDTAGRPGGAWRKAWSVVATVAGDGCSAVAAVVVALAATAGARIPFGVALLARVGSSSTHARGEGAG